MTEEINNTQEAIKEIRNATDEELRELIEKWFEKTRTDGMKLGARYIAIAVYASIKKHTQKTGKASLNDYRRCIKEINELLEVQLYPNVTQQNDMGENIDDGAATESDETNS